MLSSFIKKSAVFLLLCWAVGGFAQQKLEEKDIVYFNKYQDSLRVLEKLVFHSKTDSLRIRYNKRFLEMWDEVLLNDLSFEFSFDSLKEVARLVSPDKKFRIVNWDMSRRDGTHFYFGFIQVRDEKGHYELYRLQDHSASIKSPETHIGDHSKWFGMLYYKIIPCEDYYMLLGWDGNDKLTSRKFIDVLSFKNHTDPVFGKDVFKMPKKNPKRVMFEYSTELVMSVKYHEDKKMIVCDHLAPKDPYMEGQYQFYGPDFSYDAFKYDKGKWKYIEDVDVKNLKNKNDLIEHQSTKEKPMYTPK